MKIVHSRDVKAGETDPKVARLLGTISAAPLREWVERISKPRHFIMEKAENEAVRNWLADIFAGMGYRVERQGEYANIVAMPEGLGKEAILVGAHYDSVPNCPGADDNGSAVAAMLGCAAACSLWRPVLQVIFVAFNCEEDGLLGSREFVTEFLPSANFKVRCAHVLEMVGYASSEPGSQRVPPGLPIQLSDKGDFLGLLANGLSTPSMDLALQRAGSYVPELPVTGLSVKLGLEKYFPVLTRSDHAPFWAQNIPSVMWTDTSEFRNHHYHRPTDTPETLNYEFLRTVTQLLTACVIHEAKDLEL